MRKGGADLKENKKEEKTRREGGQARDGTEKRSGGKAGRAEPLCSRGFKVKLEEFKRIQSTYLYCTL